MTIHKRSLISLIRRYHIRIRLDCDPNFSADKATQSFTGVEELSIEVSQAQFGSSNYKVLRLFEGIRSVKRARIYGSVTAFPEYVRWLQGSMKTPQGMDFEQFDEEKHQEHLISNAWSFLPQKSSTQHGSPSRRRLSTKLAVRGFFLGVLFAFSSESRYAWCFIGSRSIRTTFEISRKLFLVKRSRASANIEAAYKPCTASRQQLVGTREKKAYYNNIPLNPLFGTALLASLGQSSNLPIASTTSIDPNGEIDFGYRDHEYSSNEGASEKLNLSEGGSTDADQVAGEERADVTLDDAHYRPRPTVSRISALDELCRLAKPLNVKIVQPSKGLPSRGPITDQIQHRVNVSPLTRFLEYWAPSRRNPKIRDLTEFSEGQEIENCHLRIRFI
ncbi:uncharacterized protein RAG0_10023 [Rhynchosporium agropyri]|uniref:Uncharacterized protein n=1 Tax=Rhynchosporium agropyri TaxID=914238 RepID=A0A1E1KY42_9HELO|nr:uncharacterized protein RAG0_10023 [Rhynchosporium agropyri]